MEACEVVGALVVETVRLELVDAGPNDRVGFDAVSLGELAASIASLGLAQPPTLRRLPSGRFEIVAGERRTRACRLLGWETMPALVRDLDDETAAAVMLAENVQRVDLDPVEEASGYSSRISRFGWSHAEVASHANVPVDRVRRRLALLALTPEVRHYVSSRQLPVTFAQAMTELDGNRQALALAAFNGTPMTAAAFRVLCGRLLGEQQTESMFDADSFLTIQEYATDAVQAVAPVSTLDVVSEPVGINEIAELLNAKVGTVRVWRTRGVLPEPKWVLSGTPAWERDTIEAWARASGRWPA